MEVGAGAGGKDRLKEIKAFTPLKKARRAGRGSKKHGGCADSVGDRYAFGNTEEQARWENLGCKARGREVDGPFVHSTGKGWVKQHDGCYRDALLNKVILHESLGGGFSPPAVAAMHRNSKMARAGLDRTKYSCPRPISYFTHTSLTTRSASPSASARRRRARSTARRPSARPIWHASPAPWARICRRTRDTESISEPGAG